MLTGHETRIAIAAAIREEDRLRMDRGNTEIVSLPSRAIQQYARKILLQRPATVRQIVVMDLESWDEGSYDHELWRDFAREGGELTKLYLIPHRGFAAASLQKQMEADQVAGIKVQWIAVTELQSEMAGHSIEDVWIIEADTVVGRLPVSDVREAEMWYVSGRISDVERSSLLWDAAWLRASECRKLSSLQLEEPLILSADLINGVANVLCTSNHIDQSTCAWYHSAWQYLRLMDMVSTPTWHTRFYADQFRLCLRERPRAVVFISGTADYSMLACILEAAADVGADPDIYVLDLCDTPLFACLWYAKRANIHITTLRESIFSLSTLAPGSVDLICADAFLTRFPIHKARQIVSIWNNLLAPGGSVVTTIRCHSRSTQVRDEMRAVRDFRMRAQEGAKKWSRFLKRTPIEIAQLAENYALRMKSNDLSYDNDESDLLPSVGLETIIAEHAAVPGELYPTIYLRTRVTKTITRS